MGKAVTEGLVEYALPKPGIASAGFGQRTGEPARVSVPFRPMLDRVPAGMWPQIHAEVHAAIEEYFEETKLNSGLQWCWRRDRSEV